MRYFDLIYCLEGLVILAKEKKMVEEITSMSEDFAQWYTDIIKRRNYAVIQESEDAWLFSLTDMLYGKIFRK